MKLNGANAEVHYHMAVCHARKGRAPKAVAALRTALQLGCPLSHVNDCTDLGPVREHPLFTALCTEWGLRNGPQAVPPGHPQPQVDGPSGRPRGRPQRHSNGATPPTARFSGTTADLTFDHGRHVDHMPVPPPPPKPSPAAAGACGMPSAVGPGTVDAEKALQERFGEFWPAFQSHLITSRAPLADLHPDTNWALLLEEVPWPEPVPNVAQRSRLSKFLKQHFGRRKPRF